jgi:hypothetical protein
MTLDKFLTIIAESQARIAVALEALVESQGLVLEQPVAAPLPSVINSGTEDDDTLDLEEELEEEELEDELEEEELEEEELDDDLDLEDELEEEEEPPARKKKTKKKAAKKKTAKKKAVKKTRVGKEDTAKSQYTADEVRSRLKDLALATGSAAQAKSILKKNGASTFGQLVVGRYDQVVAAIDKLLED